MDSLVAFAERLIKNILGIEDDLVAITELVLQLPFFLEEGDSLYHVTEVIGEVYNVMMPIGLTILSFLFLIGFFNKTMMFELVNWENILKMIFRLLVAQVVMVNCLPILAMLASIVGGIIVDVFGIMTSGEQLQELVNIDNIINEFRGMDFISQVFYAIQYLVIWCIMLIIRLGIYMIVFGRFIEVCVYTFVAPIPIATMVNDDFSHIAFKFFQSFIAVCLQGLVILLLCVTYIAVARSWIVPAEDGGSDVSLVAYLLSSLSLLFVLAKSGGWAKSIVGL